MAGFRVEVGGAGEVFGLQALKAGLAEFVAVFLFVFLGVGSVIAYNSIHDGDLDAAGLTVIALAHGIAIFVTVAATAGISGGHVNPAVTFGLAVAGQITVLRGLVYWVFQLAGAAAAAALLNVAAPSVGPLPVHHLGESETVVGGVILEVILTFALVFVVFATAVDPKSKTVIAPLAIGFTVLAAHFVGVPYTGASLNPARSFGPAVVEGDFKEHGVYWVGPLLGSFLASVIYQEFFLSPPPAAVDY